MFYFRKKESDSSNNNQRQTIHPITRISKHYANKHKKPSGLQRELAGTEGSYKKRDRYQIPNDARTASIFFTASALALA